MRHRVASVLLALLLALMTTAPAVAVGALDQEVLPSGGGATALRLDPMWQTFTAGRTGTLDTVALYGYYDELWSSTWTVSIQAVDGSGAPTGAALGSGTAAAPTGASYAWATVPISPAVPVSQGTMYAIVVSPPTPYWSFGAAYAGGSASGNALTGDLAFRTYVSQTLYVGPGGGSAPGCSAPAYSTIQTAVDAAASADTVHICAGTYTLTAPVSVSQAQLSFVGDGAGQTIVDGSHASQLFAFTGATDASFSAMTLRYGATSGSGGAVADPSGSVSTSGVDFTGNAAAQRGGAVNAATVTVSGGTFLDNVAGTDTATNGNGGAIAAAGPVILTGATFSANRATGTWRYGSGGAVYSSSGLVTVIDSTFTGNTATWGGGAVFTDATSSPALTIENSRFAANTSTNGGGAAAAWGAVTVATSEFTDNVAAHDGVTGNWGGALYSDTTATIDRSTFSGNAAYGGGAVDAGVSVTATNSTFAANASWSTGGTGGGALWSPVIAVTNSTFLDNTAPNGTGGAFQVYPGTAPAVVANTVFGSASDSCAASAVTDNGGNLGVSGACLGSSGVTSAALALGTLADNGGPTSTIALGTGSVAASAGLVATCVAAPVSGIDQRGETRHSSDASPYCSSGAYEANASASLTVTTTSLASDHPGGVPAGQPVQFTATVANVGSGTTPAGTVSVSDGTVALGSCTLSSGSCSVTTSSLAVGSHSITAAYAGDSTHGGSVADPLTQLVTAPPVVVGPIAQTIAFTLPPTGAVGATVTLAGSASSGLPVSYTSSTPAVCAVSGTALLLLAPGTCTVTATQPGAAGFAAAPPVSASVTVSAPPPAVRPFAATKLGSGTGGTFTIATKIARVGGTVTWRFSFGAAHGGQTVVVWYQAKRSNGLWAFRTRLTTRVANANGDAFVTMRSTTARWVSLAGSVDSVYTRTAQARWR